MSNKNKILKSSELDSYTQKLPIDIINRIKLNKENKNRFVNKIIFHNNYFELTINTKNKMPSISKKRDVIYSTIPYDTTKKYIQRVALQYLVNPSSVIEYIKKHEPNIKKYIGKSLSQLHKSPNFDYKTAIQREYDQIFQEPFFLVQVGGRMLQHDETGPLSASLTKKFLYSKNKNTGISQYVYQYIKFVIELLNEMPSITTNNYIYLPELSTIKFSPRNIGATNRKNDFSNNIDSKLEKSELGFHIIESNLDNPNDKEPFLKTKFASEMLINRENYIPHSICPILLEGYFKNVLEKENCNLINVVSDMHVIDGKLPFFNSNFNIFAGDIADSTIYDSFIKGICVIGNHELANMIDKKNSKWNEFYKFRWFELLLESPEHSWPLLPIGNHKFYELIRDELQACFPKMMILNNNFIIHEGVKYIGLTIPVVFVQRKSEVQEYIFNTLNELLKNNKTIPTILIWHAPMFNELSMLSPNSESYNKNYFCSDIRILELLKEYNVIGVIHGHHHIPASQGIFKKIYLSNKNIFVVCSIYSKINTGFELKTLLENFN